MESSSEVEFFQQIKASTSEGQFLSGVTAVVQCSLTARNADMTSHFDPTMQTNVLEAIFKIDTFPLEIKSYSASAATNSFIGQFNNPFITSTLSFVKTFAASFQTCQHRF